MRGFIGARDLRVGMFALYSIEIGNREQLGSMPPQQTQIPRPDLDKYLKKKLLLNKRPALQSSETQPHHQDLAVLIFTSSCSNSTQTSSSLILE
ncbi:unnamed protein product [Lactuca virosa]|uniref:Uncharacterized protein n=1 Tax=Lactuca virosa TaxID=75947 RepID=A0AAU9MW64_9ASTR|nr:unnamed protein product [Lactuca virosa]